LSPRQKFGDLRWAGARVCRSKATLSTTLPTTGSTPAWQKPLGSLSVAAMMGLKVAATRWCPNIVAKDAFLQRKATSSGSHTRSIWCSSGRQRHKTMAELGNRLTTLTPSRGLAGVASAAPDRPNEALPQRARVVVQLKDRFLLLESHNDATRSGDHVMRTIRHEYDLAVAATNPKCLPRSLFRRPVVFIGTISTVSPAGHCLSADPRKRSK
jgi:hypothetical protein